KFHNISFLYDNRLIKDKYVFVSDIKTDSQANYLGKLLSKKGLTYLKQTERTYVIMAKESWFATKQQQEVVSGRVMDVGNGESLPGVNIRLKGTSKGTTTDAEGRYELTVPSLSDTLIFSFIGFKTKEVPINGRDVLNISLERQTLKGEELVVVGYGTQQSQDVNGSVSTISSEAIENTPEVSVSQLLQGKAAGVSVSQNSGTPGGATSVRIRGITSISGNNEPLYVIDGVPISGDANNTATSGRSVVPNYSGQGNSTASPLAGLNADDIESINILKDASAQAIYGSRGANGVVIITTKSGQAGESNISYNGYVGSQEPIKYLDLMELPQYARLTNNLATLSGREPNAAFSRPEILGSVTDCQDAIFREAIMQNHQLYVSGSYTDIQYYISGGYLDQEGIILGSDFNRYTLKTNVDAQVTDWFKAGIKVNGSTSDQ